VPQGEVRETTHRKTAQPAHAGRNSRTLVEEVAEMTGNKKAAHRGGEQPF